MRTYAIPASVWFVVDGVLERLVNSGAAGLRNWAEQLRGRGEQAIFGAALIDGNGERSIPLDADLAVELTGFDLTQLREEISASIRQLEGGADRAAGPARTIELNALRAVLSWCEQALTRKG